MKNGTFFATFSAIALTLSGLTTIPAQASMVCHAYCVELGLGLYCKPSILFSDDMAVTVDTKEQAASYFKQQCQTGKIYNSYRYKNLKEIGMVVETCFSGGVLTTQNNIVCDAEAAASTDPKDRPLSP